MKAAREQLERFLKRVLPGPMPPRITALRRSTEGFSQETFFFEVQHAGERRAFVAKRAPAAGLLEPYDLEPEFRVLHALSHDAYPSPPTHWFESDPEVFERPFYVMDQVPGHVPLPAALADGSPPLDEETRHGLAPQVIDALAALHALDWQKRGFEFLGVPESPAAVPRRELQRWQERIRSSGLPVPPVIAEALHWLHENPPAAEAIGVVHGDFRLGNWLVEGDGAACALTGVLDWEMVHLGDPVEDLAWCASHLWRARTPWAAALLPPDAFVEAYQRASGKPVDPAALHWYSVLAIVKMCAIQLTGIRAFADGRSRDLRMAIFDHQLPFLCALLAVLRGWLPEAVLESG